MALYTDEDRKEMVRKLKRWRELTKLNEQQASIIASVELEEYQKIENGEIWADGSIFDRVAGFSGLHWKYFYRDKTFEEFEHVLTKKLEKEQKDFWTEYHTNPKILAEKLIAIRKAHNLTQEQMAKLAHIKRESYMGAEKGKGLLNKASISCIADFFCIPIVDLLNNELNPFIFSAGYQGRLEYPQRGRRKKED